MKKQSIEKSQFNNDIARILETYNVRKAILGQHPIARRTITFNFDNNITYPLEFHTEHENIHHTSTSNGNIDLSDIDYDFQNPFRTFHHESRSADATLLQSQAVFEENENAQATNQTLIDVGAQNEDQKKNCQKKQKPRDHNNNKNNNNGKAAKEVKQVSQTNVELEGLSMVIGEHSKTNGDELNVNNLLLSVTSIPKLQENSPIHNQKEQSMNIVGKQVNNKTVSTPSVIANEKTIFISEPILTNSRLETVDSKSLHATSVSAIDKSSHELINSSSLKLISNQPSQYRNNFGGSTNLSSNENSEYSSDERDQISTGPQQTSTPNNSW